MQTAKTKTRKIVSFDATPAERALVDKIVKRAAALCAGNDLSFDRRSAEMDLIAANANGNPMDFAKLLAADDFNLAHDVFGIARHINRETGELEDFFSPRCSKRSAA